VGVGLSLLSNLITALQVAYETARVEAGFTPNEVNGVEGVYGVVVSAVALLALQFIPVPSSAALDHGRIEDTGNTFCCLGRTPALAGTAVALGVLFAFSTQAHMVLSQRGSLFRSFVMVVRAVPVWLLELAIGAVHSASGYGETWQPWSGLQACGYVLLVVAGAWQWWLQDQRQQRGKAIDIADGEEEEGEEGHASLLLSLPPRGDLDGATVAGAPLRVHATSSVN